MATSPRISFGLYALVIKQDSIPSCSDLQPFSKILDLRTDNATSKPFITYEQDYWLLDGSYKFLPSTTVHVGLMSASMSGADGSFAIPPVLTVSFSQVHSTDSLTIRGMQASDDYPNYIRVQYYDEMDILIRDDNYIPTNWEFSTGRAVSNFKKIKVTFYSTNKPYRYLRITGIDYGELIRFTKTDIKSATLVEEMSPISTVVPVNTVELELYSNEATFSIINPSGDYEALQYRQPLAVYEIVDDNTLYIGQFYLDEWENTADNLIRFTCLDILGILDKQIYLGGIWLDGITIGALIESILEPIFAPYDLDSQLYDVVVHGWLPVCTYREALQQIGFAVGAYISCSRSGLIKIYKTELPGDSASYDAVITSFQKSINQSLTLKTLVTGVEITAHDYIENVTSTELYNGMLSAGDHTIVFSNPMHDLVISGATIASSGANHAVVTVAIEGTVVLSGQGYTDTQTVYGKYNNTIASTVKPNLVKITEATLVNYANVADVTERVYDYYQQRYLQKVKLIAPTVELGQSVLVDTLYNQQIRGIIEKMSIDLSGGFLAQTEIIGVVHEV